MVFTPGCMLNHLGSFNKLPSPGLPAGSGAFDVGCAWGAGRFQGPLGESSIQPQWTTTKPEALQSPFQT